MIQLPEKGLTDWKQFPQELGAAMRQTEEVTAYSVLTTTGNYTRTTAAGDEQHCLPFSES